MPNRIEENSAGLKQDRWVQDEQYQGLYSQQRKTGKVPSEESENGGNCLHFNLIMKSKRFLRQFKYSKIILIDKG